MFGCRGVEIVPFAPRSLLGSPPAVHSPLSSAMIALHHVHRRPALANAATSVFPPRSTTPTPTGFATRYHSIPAVRPRSSARRVVAGVARVRSAASVGHRINHPQSLSTPLIPLGLGNPTWWWLQRPWGRRLSCLEMHRLLCALRAHRVLRVRRCMRSLRWLQLAMGDPTTVHVRLSAVGYSTLCDAISPPPPREERSQPMSRARVPWRDSVSVLFYASLLDGRRAE